MRRVLVTGANKGIGLAIARAILDEHDDTFVFLGSRDRSRGEEAARALAADDPKRAARIDVVTVDVADDASVRAASEAVRDRLAGEKLYGIVNNAGVHGGGGAGALARTLEVNALGPRRVCDAFLPLLAEGGRVVIVSSASGPSFVAKCSAEMKALLLDPEITWPRLRALVDECIAAGDDAGALTARGIGDGNPYGLSKAIVNAYTQLLARENPSLRVNACTPGFIETDMTRAWVDQGKTAAEMGMKPPSEGAKAPMFLLFGEPNGNGRYYGSDAKRSPLDRYRAPGSPEHTGD